VSRHPFLAIHDSCHRHRYGLLAAAALVTLAAGLSLWWVRYDKTLDAMLPARSSIPRVMDVLRDARLTSKIAISLGPTAPGITAHDVMIAADRFAALLETSPLITRATADFSRATSVDDMALFFQAAPELLGEPDLGTIAAGLTAEGIHDALRKRYVQLMKPEGSFLAAAIRADPLGIRWRVIERLQSVTTSFGYDVTFSEGHLLSRDGRHCMIVAETPIAPTDNTGSLELSNLLDETIRSLPAGFRVDILCGQLHTVSNERMIKRDIALTNTVASVAFLLLFFVVFRDTRAVFTLFSIPVAAALIAIPLTALFFGRVALIVIGLGSVIAGVSVDYAMHVYVAARRSGNAADAVLHVALPVSLGALTTCGMFVAFFSSSVPGYHQLAVFSILSILLALLFALAVFPHFVRPGSIRWMSGGEGRKRPSRLFQRGVATVWAVLFGLCLLGSRNLGFDTNILRMDGTESRILAGEQHFYEIWGKGDTNQAIVVCEGRTAEEALQASDAIYLAMRSSVDEARVATLSAVWPSERTRDENRARWQAFWTPGRVAGVRQLLAQEGAPFGFATNAFEPFFATLAGPGRVAGGEKTNGLLAKLEGQFIQKKDEGWQSLSFYPDTSALRDLVRRRTEEGQKMIVVSPQALAGDMSRIYASEVLRISAVAGIIIVLLTFAMVRNVRVVLISLIPSATAVVSLLAVMALGGRKMDMANVFAGIVVFGLSLDYGFIMMHSYRHRLSDDSTMSVHVSAITTVIGAAALLLAWHPVLFSMGLTLTIGILAGYVTAMWVVPALYTLWVDPRDGEAA
jgi:predicted exporter